MDFILENEGKPVPDLSSVPAASSGAGASAGGDAPMDVDEDQEELAALQAAYGKAQVAPAAESAEGVEAKVRYSAGLLVGGLRLIDAVEGRASSARSAARSSRTPRSRTTTRRRAGTTSSKSPRRRCAVRP